MSSGPLTQAPASPEWEPMMYGSASTTSLGVSSGAMFWAAQVNAWEMVMSRKSSHASSRTLSILAGSPSANFCIAVSVRIYMGPRPSFTSKNIWWFRSGVGVGMAEP